MQPTARDAVKRVLTTAGITGAALTLAATAAYPAFADGGDDHGNNGQQHSSQASNGSSETGGASDDHSQSGHEGQSGDHHRQSGDHHGQSGGNNQGGQTQDPAGNNGTVKIHQTAGDSSPHNQPHVSCFFYVSFFGFDNQQHLNVSFTGQAPTGKGTPITIKDPTLTSKTSMTPAGGAGNDYDGDLGKYDGTNLDLSALGAPAKQGFHIKLDVATGAPGGHKYKVFWFSPCTGSSTSGGSTEQQQGGTEQQQGGTEQQGGTGQQPVTPTVSGEQAATGTTSGTTGGTTTGATTGTTTGGAQVLGEQISRGTTSAATGGTAPAGAQVLGEQMTRGSTAGLASLPFTGTEAGVLSALGLGAVAGGAGLVIAGRRRRRAASRA